MDYNKFYNQLAKRREVSLVNKLACSRDDLIQLGEGKSHPFIFPLEELTVRFRNCETSSFTTFEMGEAFGLGQGQGCKVMLKKLREMQSRYHQPKSNDWDVLMTTGAQEGLSKAIEATIETGDAILVQQPMYFGLIGVATPLLPEFLGINQDRDGILPEEIERKCEERLRDGKPMPKLLYVNPTGSNPTGSVLSESRRRRVYELAQKYDFLIVEDDPYYFLHFLDKPPTSFFSLDTDGRVIRLDSFSKIMSGGIRLGVVTAHKELIAKLVTHVEHSIMHCSSLSQMLVFKLLDTWGPEKFQDHFTSIQKFYRERRNIMLACIEKHLTGLAEWSVPNGGMFFWVKVTVVDDVMDVVTNKCVPQGVFVLPGHAFNLDFDQPDNHIRLCYSYATPAEIDKALSILAKLLREEAAKAGRPVPK